MTDKLPLRILFSINAVWASSGYAQQGLDILPLIRDELEPHNLAASNFFGQAGGKFILSDILQYPVINHTYGSDAMVQHGNDFTADVVMSLQDVWVLNQQDLASVRHWVPYVPIDHDPIPLSVTQSLRYAYRIISMSRFGQREIERVGLSSYYIPHSVNTEIFKPLDKAIVRKEYNMPQDAFIIGMVAANKDNPPRKSFQEVMDAFMLLLPKIPRAMLYFHTNPEFPGGFNMLQYAAFLGITEKLIFPENYKMNFNTTKADMAKIYNTFDLLAMPSISEGFGIPAIEAQACGIPVIVNNFTSMPELVKRGVTGEISEVGYKRFTPQGSYTGIPDHRSIYESMVKIVQSDRKQRGIKAREWILENYSLSGVFDSKWRPFLRLLSAELKPATPPAKPSLDNTK